ncbi:MAG TPA: choice-of-anchor D domain-containing protein [Candidatus Sulfotelmatobacter sp.]|nr:choice-of-anchor D domain-containing protein [Candidatus Sulfotelmatobacter sp.]
MSTRRYLACILGLTGSASLLLALAQPDEPAKLWSASAPGRRPLSLPLAFEKNVGQASPITQFVGRGRGLTVLLTGEGMEVVVPGAASKRDAPRHALKIRFSSEDLSNGSNPDSGLSWRGEERLRGVSNYFLGNDPRNWRTNVAQYARASVDDVLNGVGVTVYGNEEGIEYDLRIEPQTDAEKLYLQLSGAEAVRLDVRGDLYLRAGDNEIKMRKPVIYQELHGPQQIEGGYVLRADGKVGFRIGPHAPDAALVLDPSLSVSYSTFLGGAGDDTANSIALDSAGNLYIGGTTTSASTFPEPTGTRQGPGGGVDFFIAKINPAVAGSGSLVYLTFIGGSGDETGGNMALDGSSNAAIMGVTTSSDYPVTDGSKRTAGTNDLAVTEIDPTGSKLVYSTLFGGSGAESTQSAGGVAFGLLNSVEYIYVVADTTSTDLPVTPVMPQGSPFQSAYGGGISDGFLTIFQPAATPPTPHLFYCTYLGINAQVGVSSVAVDAGGNAYVAGFTSNPGTSFSALNGFQTVYGGDPFDAFLMEFNEYGTGSTDLAYGTFLGGSASDQAFAVTVGVQMPATAYVTGTTSSTNFPMSTITVGPQTTLFGNPNSSNAFLAVVGQTAPTSTTPLTTSLLYSTYLGGSQTVATSAIEVAGLAVAVTAPNSVYVAGKTTSWFFPWLDNLQPFYGDADAFVVKLDSTMAGASSLIYATPLGGTAPPGLASGSSGNAIAANGSGDVFVAGETLASNFPLTSNPANGFQITCTSCQSSPQAGDAFVVAVSETQNPSPTPSVSFNLPNCNFNTQTIGSTTVPPCNAGLVNTGSESLTVTSLGITGINSADFALIMAEPCLAPSASIPQGTTCSFEIGFTPSIGGPEQAFLIVEDNAAGNPQSFELKGIGNGPFAVFTPSSMSFGTQPVNSTSQPQVLTISNQGNQPLILTQIQAAGASPGEFIFKSAACSTPLPIQPGSSCGASVSFAPTSAGNFQAEIDVTDNSGGTPGAVQRVPLSGTGAPPAPLVTVTPLALSFGNQAVGTSSGGQAVSISNNGSAALSILSIGLSGTDAGSFGVAPSGTSPCQLGGGSIAIGASCTVTVNFSPLASGARAASLNINDNASGSPQTVALSGTGIAPAVQLAPSNVDFGTQTVGVQSAAQNIVLSNVGASPLAVAQISIAGSNAGDFHETNNCPPSLAVAANCSISVTVTPTVTGNRTANLNVEDNAAGSPQTVMLAGVAVQAAITLSPISVSFGNEPVGSSSQPVTVTATDSGPGKLLISKISLSGANAGDFSETDNCSSSISPAGFCTIQVTFTPSCSNIPVTRNASLNLTDNAPGSPHSVMLSGTAAGNFCIDPPASGPAQTVSPGQSATYPLTLISMAGFSGSAMLTCAWTQGVPPAGASCSVPSSIPLAANSTAPFQVVVSTMAPASRRGSVDAGNRRNVPLALGLSGTVFLLAMPATLVIALANRPKSKNISRFARAAAIGTLVAIGAACGGSGGVGSANSGTGPGTSQLTVTASAGGTASALTLTLTVN